jgi:hypothetical protein
MLRLTSWSLLAQLLISSANGQNNSAATCTEIDNYAQWNSSTTRQIQALKIEGETDDNAVVNDALRTWELSYRVQNLPTYNKSFEPAGEYYYGAMFLDTGNSDMTKIGSCHQTLQAQIAGLSYSLSKSVLERSMNDNGDCTIMLGQECVDAMKKQATLEAARGPLRTGSCSDMNRIIPEQCSGVGPQLVTRRTYHTAHAFRTSLTNSTAEMNLTYFSGIQNGYSNSRFDPSLECNSVNASSTHILTVTDRIDYDPAVRFPVIDVITFFPNRSSGSQNYMDSWKDDVRVEMVCMRPSDVVEGSRIPPTASEILSNKSIQFPGTSLASTVTCGVLGWVSAVVMGIMIIL